MMKSFRVRIYPDKEQELLMWKHVSCCRYVWNYMLGHQIELREAGEKHLSRFDMIRFLTVVKKDGEHDWLYEVDNASLQTVCTDLDGAYRAFFKKKRGYPKFKSKKKSKPNFPLRTNVVYFNEKGVHLPKMGFVKYKTDLDIPKGKGVKFSNARVSFVDNKWMLSFGMRCENQAPVLTDKSMGIDLGVKDLAAVAFGDERLVFHNINKSARVRRLKRNLVHTQRSVSRKYENSKAKTGKYEKTNNIIREEEKVRKIYAKLANIRNNYIHQTTHKLISLLPKRIVMEDLNVTGMMKNRHLSRVIAEQGFAEFLRQVRYKCEWNNIEFVQAYRFFPSSKTCSVCGYVREELKLSERTYVCPECGATIDRDYNAAINLMKYIA